MSNSLVGTRAFDVSPEADRLHAAGLNAELAGDYDQAHQSFDTAQRILDDLQPTIHTAVQSARILRDKGFTFVRSAISASSIEYLERADETIEQAWGKTFLQVLAVGNSSPGPVPPLIVTGMQRRELVSEHGATTSLMGRAATVREVVFDTGRNEDKDELFENAHSFLKQGSNGYYRVSNTMVAARSELIHGDKSQAYGLWLSRAAVGLATTFLNDQHNLVRAAGTSASRTRHLVSQQAAIDSVEQIPSFC